MQEAGTTVDNTESPFLFDEKGSALMAASKRADAASKRKLGEPRVKGESARKTALNADQDAWEANRLLTR
jgi:hypothetical protein